MLPVHVPLDNLELLMPLLVNGETIPPELIRDEERRLADMPQWREVPDTLEKRMSLRQSAEAYVVDRILLRQQADKDPRPIDPEVVAARVRASTALQSCRVLFDTGSLSRQIEGQLRLERAMQELIGPVPEPTEEEIEHIYKTQRHNFQRPEIVTVAHIVKHVDELRSEEEARLAIEAALDDLQGGESFAAVADRHSDCKGNGGYLGSFERGVMVEEFDEIVFALRSGERSPIFRTPFGFHIAEVRSKTSGTGIAEFKEVYDTIKLFLVAMRQQEAARNAAERLRAQAQISRISDSKAQRLASQRSRR